MTDAPTPPKPRFNAFMSYSHSPGQQRVARAIQDALRSFAKPFWKFRVVRLYRDESNLTASPDLWGAIVAALDDSDFLLLFASQEAARSKWVQKEFTHWVQTRGADTIIIVHTGGELVWNASVERYDDEKTTALPPAALTAFPAEPLHVDLRWALDPEARLTLGNPRFSDAVATLSATIRGISKDEIFGKEISQRRLTRVIVGAVAMVIAAVSVAAYFQHRIAAERAAMALSRQLAAQATTVGASSQGRDATGKAYSWLLGVEAYRASPTVDAHRALAQAIFRHPADARLFESSRITRSGSHALSGDGRYLALPHYDRMEILEVESGKRVGLPLQMSANISSAALDATGKWVAVVLSDPFDRMNPNYKTGARLEVWDLMSRKQVGMSIPIPNAPSAGAFVISDSGTAVAFEFGERGFAVLNPATGELDKRAVDAIPVRVSALAFAADEKRMVVGMDNGHIVDWDRESAQTQREPVALSDKAIQAIAVSADGNAYLAITDDRAFLLHGSGSSWLRFAINSESAKFNAGRFVPQTESVVLWAGSRLINLNLRTREIASMPFVPDVETLDRASIGVSANAVTTVAPVAEGFLAWRMTTSASAPDPSPAHDPGKGRSWINLGSGTDKLTVVSSYSSVFASSDGDKRVYVKCDDHPAFHECRPVIYLSRKPFRDLELLHNSSLKRKIHAVAFSPDGKWLAAGDDDGNVTVWDGATYAELPVQRKDGPPRVKPMDPIGNMMMMDAAASSLVFSPDGKTLYGAVGKAEIHIFHTASQSRADNPVRVHSRPSALIAARDGTLLATVSTEILAFDRAPRFQQTYSLIGHTATVSAIAASPTTDLVASASEAEIIIWNLTQRQQVLRLPVSTKPGNLSFSQDGKQISFQTPQGRRSVTIDPEELARIACAASNRNMSHDEWRLTFGSQQYRKTCQGLPVHRSFVDTGYAAFDEGRQSDGIAIFKHVAALDDAGPQYAGNLIQSASRIASAKVEAAQGNLDAVQSHLVEAKRLDHEKWKWIPADEAQRKTAIGLAASMWEVADAGDFATASSLAARVQSPALRRRDINASVNVESEILSKAENSIRARVLRAADETEFNRALALIDGIAEARAVYENRKAAARRTEAPAKPPMTAEGRKAQLVKQMLEASMDERIKRRCMQAGGDDDLPLVTLQLNRAAGAANADELRQRYRDGVAQCLVRAAQARADHLRLSEIGPLLEHAKKLKAGVYVEDVAVKTRALQSGALNKAALSERSDGSPELVRDFLRQASMIESRLPSSEEALMAREADAQIRASSALRLKDVDVIVRELQAARKDATPEFMAKIDGLVKAAISRPTSPSDVAAWINLLAALSKRGVSIPGIAAPAVDLCARSFAQGWAREAVAACDVAATLTDHSSARTLLSRGVARLLTHDPTGAKQDFQAIARLDPEQPGVEAAQAAASRLMADVESGNDTLTPESLRELGGIMKGR